MSLDRWLFIGGSFGVGETAFPLLGTQNLDEANAIVWTPTTVLNEFNQHGPIIPKATYATFQARMSALAGWSSEGTPYF